MWPEFWENLRVTGGWRKLAKLVREWRMGKKTRVKTSNSSSNHPLFWINQMDPGDEGLGAECLSHQMSVWQIKLIEAVRLRRIGNRPVLSANWSPGLVLN